MIRYRWLWFLFALGMLGVFWPLSGRLRLDRSLEKMFPAGDIDRVVFERVEARFGVSQFLVFAYRDAGLWERDGSGLERVREWRKRIEGISGVRYALDLSRVDEMLETLQGPTRLFGALSGGELIRPLLDEKNKLAMEYREMFAGQTHARESDLVAIGVLLERGEREDSGETGALASLRRLSEEAPGGLLVGHLAMVDEGFREIERDGQRLAFFSTVCLSVLMLAGFRSLRWALIVVLVVQWSLVVTRGLLVWLDWELTMVSSMLSSIVMVVGVATTLHWMFGYQSHYARSEGLEPQERAKVALQASFKQLWWPIFWAVVTDAIGFGALGLSRVGPVQDYGCMMALACGMVLIGIFCLVPTLALLPVGGFALGRLPGEATLQRGLQGLLAWSCRRAIWVIGLSIVCLIVAMIGSKRLAVETDFLKNFQEDSPIAEAYRAVETELGGAGVWDVAIPAPKPMTEAYLDLVLEMERALLAIEVPSHQARGEPLRLTSALSLADTDRVGRQSSVLRMIPIEARWLGMGQTMGSFYDTLVCEVYSEGVGDYGHDGRWLRVMLRSKERSDSEQKAELIERVRRVVSEYTDRIAALEGKPIDERRGEVTGYYVLLTKLVEHVVSDQWLTFAVATLGIGFAMWFALGSILYALVGLIPVVIPSFLVLGMMGWLGVRVNLGAAMIAAVSMGLGVDASLHSLHKYRMQRQAKRSVMESLRVLQSETGMAVMMSTVALVIGFGSMAASQFLPTVAFGTLAAWTMLGGLFGNLCLLPALIWVVEDGGRD